MVSSVGRRMGSTSAFCIISCVSSTRHASGNNFLWGKSDDTRVQIPALSLLWYLNDHASLMASESSNRKKLSLSNYFRLVKLIEITQSPHELLIYSTATLQSPGLPLNSHKLFKTETEQLWFQLLIFIYFAVSHPESSPCLRCSRGLVRCRLASDSQLHTLCRCFLGARALVPLPPTRGSYIKYASSFSYATSVTHNCCSLSNSQRSFVIRAYIHFPNRHGGDGQPAHACGCLALLLAALNRALKLLECSDLVRETLKSFLNDKYEKYIKPV